MVEHVQYIYTDSKDSYRIITVKSTYQNSHNEEEEEEEKEKNQIRCDWSNLKL